MDRDEWARNVMATVAAQHPKECDCPICRAVAGDEQALNEVREEA